MGAFVNYVKLKLLRNISSWSENQKVTQLVVKKQYTLL
jgi:hypothetical protein